jgi:phosphatidylserine/phosphatidylglycerophosphate/cardiolipin synthase-like enzyme
VAAIALYHSSLFTHITSSDATDSNLAASVALATSNNDSNLALITEPDAGISPILNAITNATSSVDLVMYQLEDPAIEQALAVDKSRGISVRVLLNGGYYGKPDSPNVNQLAYDFLKSHDVSVEWTPARFALTHEKSLVIDNIAAYILTFNFTPQYYASSRDFGVIDTDTRDVNAMEQTFDDDWNDISDAAGTGDDLVWSPGSENTLISTIDNANKTLLVYNEEINDADVTQALVNAAQRGVSVEVVMTYSSEWKKSFTQLKAAGVQVKTFDPKATLYIHAKMILADGKQAFVGSENFSPTSLNKNRELGLMLTDSTVLISLSNIFNTDFNSATAF